LDKFEYPKILDNIFDKLNDFGIKTVIVGGYVRDYFLSISSKDIDIEVYHATSYEDLKKILCTFGDPNIVGKSFGVCKLNYQNLDLDFSFPRKESKISKGHKGFKITIEDSLDFKDASKRRDFTINSIGYDTKEKKLLDPHGGLKDIHNKTLRATDIKKFDEDPLRYLRAIRFASQLNFNIDDELFAKLRSMMQNSSLDELPKERVFDEFKKILLKSLKPSKAFMLLKQLDGFRYFKHFSKLLEKEFENILLSLDFFASDKHNSDKTNLVIMLAIVIKFFDDEDKKGFLEKLTDEKKLISQSIKLSKIEFDVENFDEYELNILSTTTEIEIYAKFLNSIHQDKTFSSKLLAKAKNMGILNSRPTPIINGKELIEMGLKPSKDFKDILDKIYDAQLRGLFDNIEDGKKYAIIIATNK